MTTDDLAGRAGPGDAGRPGRQGRDNGLQATRYLALADLDPRVAGALLAPLARAGVAAYVAPTPAPRGGYLETRMPARLTDRLWVDAGAVVRAREVLAAEVPERPGDRFPVGPGDRFPVGPDRSVGPADRSPADEEDVWRELVAAYAAPVTDPVPPWPVYEDLDGPPASPPVLAAPPDEDHFVPPPPGPGPVIDRASRLAWLVLLVSVAVLIGPAVLGHPVSAGLAVLAGLAVVGAFGTLVYRMRDRPPPDSRPDDGAVV